MNRRIFTSAIVATAIAGITLAAGAAPADAAARTGSISGTILDTKGAALADAQVSIYHKNVVNGSVTSAHTDAAGHFSVPGLAVGKYKIQINAGGWFEWAPGKRTSDTDATAYQVSAGHDTVADSVVTAPATITGKVTGSDGQAAGGVTVSAENDTTAFGWYADTAADGTYTLKVNPTGTYVLGFRDGQLQQFAPATIDRNAATHYQVRSGRTLTVNQRLLAAPTLTGHLLDAAGAPVAGATVRFVTEFATDATTTTDTNGAYTFAKASPGNVKVEFTTATGQDQWAYQQLTYDAATSFTLTPGTTTTVDDQLLPLS